MSAQQALLVHVPGSENYWFNILQDTAATFGIELDDQNFDSSGNLVVAGTSNLQNHFWHKIGKNGNIIATGSWKDSTASSADVSDIAIDESDNIYMANGNGRFIKWNSSNNIVYSTKNTWSQNNQAYGGSGTGYGSLTLSGNTLIYQSIGSNRRVLQVDSSTGLTTSATTSSGGSTIFGVGGFGKTSQGNFLCGYVNGPGSNNDNWRIVTTTSLQQQFCFYNGGGAAICRGIDYINGSYHIVGLKQTDNSFAGDGVIFKIGTYSGSGNQGVTWARRIRNAQNTSQGSYQTQLYDVAGDSEGNIYVVGHSPNPGTTTCGIMLKYNSGGTVIWSRFFENSSGSTMCTKITIVNDVIWVNINISGDKCAVAKLPINGEFMGNYCGLTVTDWSQGYQGGFTSSSITHTQQSGSTPNFVSGGSTLTLGSGGGLGYTEPTVSPTECKSILTSIIGQEEFTTSGSYTWVAPSNVTSVSVVAVGAGGDGGSNKHGDGGGGLGWKNDIPVTPGQSYTVVVGNKNLGGGDSYFLDYNTVRGGGGGVGDSSPGGWGGSGGTFVGDGGGNGGNGGTQNQSTGGSGGGGGAGGYTGNGGNGGTGTSFGASSGNQGNGGAGGGGAGASWEGGAGGGVGLLGEGTNGAGASTYDGGGAQSYGHCGKGGSGGAPQTFAAFPSLGPGSGGGGGNGIAGSNGAVRIIWGSGRSFPSTNTGDI